ncbi:MAG: hypothetical protein WCP95_00180 [Actinomycetes bacterium]
MIRSPTSSAAVHGQDCRIRTWAIGAVPQERTVLHANGQDFTEEYSTQPQWRSNSAIAQ